MKRKDLELFITELAKLAEAVGEEELTESRYLIYFEDLQDFPLEVVVRSIRRARKEMKWFPKIPELRDYCHNEMNLQQRIEADRQIAKNEEWPTLPIEKVQELLRPFYDKVDKSKNNKTAFSERKMFLKKQAEQLLGQAKGDKG